MTDFEREPMPEIDERHTPLPGLDPFDAHQIEEEVHSELAHEASARGDMSSAISHGLAATRAWARGQGWENVRNEDEFVKREGE
jgi:hypothetical protein